MSVDRVVASASGNLQYTCIFKWTLLGVVVGGWIVSTDEVKPDHFGPKNLHCLSQVVSQIPDS